MLDVFLVTDPDTIYGLSLPSEFVFLLPEAHHFVFETEFHPILKTQMDNRGQITICQYGPKEYPLLSKEKKILKASIGKEYFIHDTFVYRNQKTDRWSWTAMLVHKIPYMLNIRQYSLSL